MNNFRGCVDFTHTEYIDRLQRLLPEHAFSGRGRFTLDSECIIHSACQIELLANELFRSFSELKDTDFVAELRDTATDLAVLGRFLGITLEALFEDKP